MSKSPIEIVRAVVYVPRGETTKGKLRAKISGGNCDGLRVSCPHSIREKWSPGMWLSVTGRVVSSDSSSSYFKASEVS